MALPRFLQALYPTFPPPFSYPNTLAPFHSRHYNHLSAKYGERHICPARAFPYCTLFIYFFAHKKVAYNLSPRREKSNLFQSSIHQTHPTFFYSNTLKPPSPHATLQSFIRQTRPTFFLSKHTCTIPFTTLQPSIHQMRPRAHLPPPRGALTTTPRIFTLIFIYCTLCKLPF